MEKVEEGGSEKRSVKLQVWGALQALNVAKLAVEMAQLHLDECDLESALRAIETAKKRLEKATEHLTRVREEENLKL
jgi:UDP-N-acetylmuramate-alanine ligase